MSWEISALSASQGERHHTRGLLRGLRRSGSAPRISRSQSGSPMTRVFIVTGARCAAAHRAYSRLALWRVDRHRPELARGRDFEDLDIVRGAQLVMDAAAGDEHRVPGFHA